jgi:hypothetical protein
MSFRPKEESCFSGSWDPPIGRDDILGHLQASNLKTEEYHQGKYASFKIRFPYPVSLNRVGMTN